MTRYSTAMPLPRRTVLGLMAAMAVTAACRGGNGEEATEGGGSEALTDLRGRPLQVAGPVSRMTIDDGRYLIGLALIHPDPVSVLSGWSGDINRIGPELYADYVARFPKLAELPTTPSSAADFNVEQVLAANPEVALLSLEAGVTDAQVQQLEGAGVKAAFVDFFSHPFENQARSLSLLGTLTGREAQADEFNRFRADKLQVISSRVAEIPENLRPTVFLEAHAGQSTDCCNSPGKGNVGDYIAFVGGRNIGADVLNTPSGKLNLEYVIERDPDVYIATGGPHLARTGGFVVGSQFSQDQSRASLKRMSERRGIASLSAVREGRVHGLSHQLINSPIDIVATEALARWIHPELFGDLDPRRTLDDINSRFLAVPYRGEYWTDLATA